MASKNIVSVLQEERTFAPSAGFAARARIKPADLERMRRQAADDASGFWAELARRELAWQTPFTIALDESDAPNYRWFTDGRLNVSFNCLDVHLAERADKTAIIFEGEPGDTRRVSYRELHAEVCRFANALKGQGIRKGDRVAIYLPLVPEAIVAMHACNRIGAIHSVVFGGFSAPALKDRIEDTGARMLITADGGWRGGHPIELKAAADKALASGCASIERVIVLRRTGRPVAMQRGRDLWWHELLAGQAAACEPEWVEAEHPLYLLYTSGSTGKPKGIQHSSGGFLLGAKVTAQWVFDLRDDDVFWCTADVGWVTGHSYVAYGPLAAGATVMLYEGAPTTPDAGRFWKICQDHGVTVFYTAPTAIRALMKLGDEFPGRYDLSRLRLLGSVGEPINPEAWMWYHRVIGRGRCPIVDTWWQTETGMILISPLPGVTPTKPGSCTLPLPGIEADIVDEHGEPVTRPDAGGYLVIRKPWPAMLRTIWGNNARYLAAYWEKFNRRFYVAGDSAHRDKDGYFWIMGRIDDVLNVAGHRLGTMEIESALVSHARVAEAAVVGKPHEIKGEAVFAYVVCRGQRPTGDASALVSELRTWVGEHLGAIAKPDEIRFADNLPKTRSGKIMRRLLRAIARGEEIAQDVSTLENPAILDQLRGVDAPAAAPAPAAKPAASPSRRSSRPANAAAGAAASAQSSPRARVKAKGKPAPRVRSRSGKSAPRRAAARPAAGKSTARATSPRPARGRSAAAAKRRAKRKVSSSKTAGRRAPVKRASRSKPARRAARKSRSRR
ncbi:MAG TPA: acetate--CoA ligase [Steroidobacteraceae bacterium]|nr:acetate--CoA ligase [Steroidobacteraceae bacterium]